MKIAACRRADFHALPPSAPRGQHHRHGIPPSLELVPNHNLQQAARVSDRTVFMWMGKLIEVGNTAKMVLKPEKKLTEDYLTPDR
jgi:hypothetical protein